MIKYKDTSQALNAPQRAGRGQNNGKITVSFAKAVNEVLTFLLLAGVLLLITHCQPVQGATQQAGNKTAPFPEKLAENNIGMFQETGNKNHLQSVAGMGQNSVTTKHKAVKPNRHSLAIFVPKINPTTNRTIATGAKQRHNNAHSVTSYDGLIGGNTKPKGNTPSRLYAVVESRHPMTIHRVANLTNHKGGHYHA